MSANTPIYEAVEVLFTHRHTLPADILRSLESIYLCASAAQYGEPYESGWLDKDHFDDAYGDHDVTECEAECASGAGDALIYEGA